MILMTLNMDYTYVDDYDEHEYDAKSPENYCSISSTAKLISCAILC